MSKNRLGDLCAVYNQDSNSEKIIFRADCIVEDGQEVQQQRARVLGRQGLRLTSISKWAWEPDKVLGRGAIKAEVGFKSS